MYLLLDALLDALDGVGGLDVDVGLLAREQLHNDLHCVVVCFHSKGMFD